MNNETALLQQAERQNGVIDALLKENAYLKQIINQYLLPAAGAGQPELALLALLTGQGGFPNTSTNSSGGNSGSYSSFTSSGDGNSESYSGLAHSGGGNSGSYSFLTNIYGGNSGSNTAFANTAGGKSGSINAVAASDEEEEKALLARLAAQLRPLMPYAGYQSQLNTAKILMQLRRNPATPIPELRRLSGLSPGGMSKRIMVLKRQGLIVRYSHPLRYVLTEKANSFIVKAKAHDV